MREILCVCVWMCSLNINNAYFSSNLSLQNQVGKETHNQSEQQILLACTLSMRWRLFFFLIVFITLLFICYFGCGRGYLWRQWFLKKKKRRHFPQTVCYGSVLVSSQCTSCAQRPRITARAASMRLFLSALLSPTASPCPIIALLAGQCLPNNWNLIKFGRLMCSTAEFWHPQNWSY